jgi:CRP/FNR family transcriptional regulator
MKNACETCVFKSKAVSKLHKDQIDMLSFNCATSRFRKGDSIIKQGMLSTNIAYLQSGLAKIHIAGPYHEQIVRVVKAPCYLGLPTTIGDKINQYSVTVIEDAGVCFIDIGAFRNLMKENFDFANEIMIDLCRNEIEAFYRCANRTQKQMRGKIADILLELADRIYLSDTFNVPLTQAEFGNLVDVSRESVSLVLNEFIKENILVYSKKQIKILNKLALMMISANG